MRANPDVYGNAIVLPILTIVSIVLMVIFFPLLCRAAPREVILFPSSASVTDITKIVLPDTGGDGKRTILSLPPSADPDSLVIRLSPGIELSIMDQRWQKVSVTDSEKIVKLRQRIQDLQLERNKVQAAIQSLDTQIQFWQLQTKAKVKSISEAHSTAAAIGKNMRQLIQEKLEKDAEIEKIDKKMGELREELNRISGARESAWEVTLLLAGRHSGETVLTCTYTLSGCGWQPLYRLDARPASNEVKFSWQAELWQSSGQDWNQVELSIATLHPPRSISPPDLPPWIIRPETPIPLRAKHRAEAAGVDAMEAEAPQVPLPEQERKNT